MRSGSDAIELLRLARRALLEDLLGSLPEERRYEALMAANAMAIAARESQAGDADLRAELELLRELYGERAIEEAGAGLREKLVVLNRRLAKDIRAGVMDGACAQGVRALLRAQVVARLRISNPGHLESWGLE